VDESMQTSIDGIFACGNVVHVHDLVDYVTQESRLAGSGAAAYIKGQMHKGGKRLNTAGKKGVRYVVPQSINAENVKDSVTFFMRVADVYKNVYLIVKHNGNEISKYRRNIVSPGEMEHVNLKKDVLESLGSGELSFELCEVQ
jgi:hypothetical protein